MDGYRAQAEVPHCSRCQQAFEAGELVLTADGAWICQPCTALAQARVAGKLATNDVSLMKASGSGFALRVVLGLVAAPFAGVVVLMVLAMFWRACLR